MKSILPRTIFTMLLVAGGLSALVATARAAGWECARQKTIAACEACSWEPRNREPHFTKEGVRQWCLKNVGQHEKKR